jgi:molecular chaperone Hsp33
MSEPAIAPNHNDLIVPFQLAESGLRGRFVRLGATLDEILGKHQYPAPVAALVAEAATLAAVLGSLLKDDGIFSLQAKGDGPVSMLVADYTPDGALRAYAAFDADKIHTVPNSFAELLGNGYLAFTIERDGEGGRYQGIVEIEGKSLCAAAQHYFLQSEQIRTELKFFIRPHLHSFRTAAVCIQAMPPETLAESRDLDELPKGWEEVSALLATLTPLEALDAPLHPHDILYRLFHEGGVRVHETVYVTHRCRCSLDRAERALAALTPAEAEELADNRILEVRCEFCNSAYQFTLEEVARLRAKATE